VTAYAQLHIKFRYDKNYTSLFLNTGDTAFLNFHQGYRVPNIYNKKFAQQRIKSFRIICRVSFLIYEFEFSNNINIYPVIFITHLKLTPKGSDPYNRSRNDYLILVKEDL
jgi:hypothetical protein